MARMARPTLLLSIPLSPCTDCQNGFVGCVPYSRTHRIARARPQCVFASSTAPYLDTVPIPLWFHRPSIPENEAALPTVAFGIVAFFNFG
jgi:hypothetical protein